jgi:hypothetical protein
MIADRFPRCLHLQTAKDFAEWASLYGGKIFVDIVAYVDESGTHDITGKLRGSREAVIGGYAAPKGEWIKFQARWRTILRRYRVCYFHFCEWTDAFQVANGNRPATEEFKKKNPYAHLQKSDLDKFILELAAVAGGGDKVVLGNCVHLPNYTKAVNSGQFLPNANPYHECVKEFFSGFRQTIKMQFPTWNMMPVSFFFDQSDKRWVSAVHEIYDDARKVNRNFREIAFADKKRVQMLQAADMVAFRSRQMSQNFVDDKIRANWTELDESVFKPVFRMFERQPQLVKSGMMVADLLQSGLRNPRT